MLRETVFLGALALTGSVFLTVALDAGQQAGAPNARTLRGGVETRGATAPPRAAQAVKPAPAGPLPPMPLNGPLARPRDIVAAVYEFAARHPEVLNYVPCYCGCEQIGHRGNHDCFVRSRDANGRVQWNDHGTHCAVCIDVARDAMLMFNSGASVIQIRAAIDQKWGSQAIAETPTPKPPAPPARRRS